MRAASSWKSGLGVTEFCSEYPDSEIAKTRKTTGNAARDVMDDILVAEYIRVEDDPDELILLSNGEKGWKSDLLALPPDVTIVNTRKSARRTVRNYKIAGKCVGDDGADFGEVIERRTSRVSGFRFSRSMAETDRYRG